MNTPATLRRFGTALAFAALATACGHQQNTHENPQPGDTEFESAPPGGQGASNGGGRTAGADAAASADASASPSSPGTDSSSGGMTRQVEETDIFRVDGNRLYYLNGYRGLMVFDITDVDHPRAIGRSAIYGYPVEMIVRNGVAFAIVADWYGVGEDGAPFHGSVVRAIDARDAANVHTTSETRLGGWVRDARVVGDVLYAVSEDYGWYEDSRTYTGPSVSVSAVNLSDPAHLTTTGSRSWNGYNGIFNVTQNAILFAHDATDTGAWSGTGVTQIDYVDISDPTGTIVPRGSITIDSHVQGWGPNNGRFNIDFDGRYVRALGMHYGESPSYENSYVLTTIDAQNPDTLTQVSTATLGANGWVPAARFDRGRMYLSPSGYYYSGTGETTTPLEVYDVSDPVTPRLTGTIAVEGSISNFIPAGDRLFAIGSSYNSPSGTNPLTLQYLDVADVNAPRLLGTSEFGAGWGWTPAANDFKAFTFDAPRGLVVVPFSGWDERSTGYHNGVQLIAFDHDTLTTAGAAQTTGWVERGVFVGNRIYSLSDMALQVVDYTDAFHPSVVSELTLARNIIDVHPMGDVVAELSTDWWDHLTDTRLRILPTSDPDDEHLTAAITEITIPGVNARVFHDGSMAYVVSNVGTGTSCGSYYYYYGGDCRWSTRIQTVDLTIPTAPRLRGAVDIAYPSSGYYGYYGYGYYWGWYGWWDGDQIVQVRGNVLALRRPPTYDPSTGRTRTADLAVVNLANPDAPTLANLAIATPDAWWGALHAVNNRLFLTHYDWLDRGDRPTVRYYLDEIDVTDASTPRVSSRVNIPGVFVGASADMSHIYTIDYRWDATDSWINTFNVLSIEGGHAHLVSRTDVDAYLGNVQVRGERAYFSAEHYDRTTYESTVQLHALDLSDPAHPVDRVSGATRGWGWLLGIEGDRAVLSASYGAGVNVYRLVDGAAPQLESFQRTRGWWGYNLSRQDDTLFLATGYWGVQTIQLAH